MVPLRNRCRTKVLPDNSKFFGFSALSGHVLSATYHYWTSYYAYLLEYIVIHDIAYLHRLYPVEMQPNTSSVRFITLCYRRELSPTLERPMRPTFLFNCTNVLTNLYGTSGQYSALYLLVWPHPSVKPVMSPQWPP